MSVQSVYSIRRPFRHWELDVTLRTAYVESPDLRPHSARMTGRVTPSAHPALCLQQHPSSSSSSAPPWSSSSLPGVGELPRARSDRPDRTVAQIGYGTAD